MATTGVQNQGKVPMNLKKQLALAVRNIQWSYGIFWSISAKQPGVLEWGDGYYNGDIKTRKTVQSFEPKADDQLGLQRSEQLRELFESLSAGETSPHTKRPSVALSPEDLTATEWYYLVCMSFVFNIDQGLPGRTLSIGQPIWLCNAQYADSKVFSRSLVAKSASIQTVVCFPYAGGVIELGVTDLVSKDLGLVRRVKSLLLDAPKTITGNINDVACPGLGPNEIESELSPFLGCEQLERCSPNEISDGFEPNQLAEDPFVNGGASQSSPQFILGPHLGNSNKESGFISWKMNSLVKYRKAKVETPQKLLKKMLFEVPRMHDKGLLQPPQVGDGVGDAVWRPEADELCKSHVLTERRRREKINERLTILKSLVPTNSKADKVSILDDTIEYLQDLERRVEELECCRELTESETKTKRKYHRDRADRTSSNKVTNGNKSASSNKRKAYDIEETKQDIDHVASKDGSTDNLTVNTNNKDLTIEFKCRWRDGILFEIMDALSVLDLDCHSVQSSTVEGILSVTIKSRYKGSSVAKPGTIKQALLQKVQSLTFV
ncbi:Transcription factor MYC1 -like protein [Gossypium arboreum]|uniref:Transcription factor MYC1-like protein n=1 Tax=Gossypium arboreum TaxID=29729 RepID=A0A0B0NRI6_GOSAR|nr:Transcription factor MYC1 -like protein [Gossypium arboreum]